MASILNGSMYVTFMKSCLEWLYSQRDFRLSQSGIYQHSRMRVDLAAQVYQLEVYMLCALIIADLLRSECVVAGVL